MVEDMNISEIAVKLAEENQTRKIISIVEKSKDKEEILEKLEALLEK